MSQGLQRNSKGSDQISYTSVSADYSHIQVAIKSNGPDITTFFHVRQDGRFMEIKVSLRKKLHRTN